MARTAEVSAFCSVFAVHVLQRALKRIQTVFAGKGDLRHVLNYSLGMQVLSPRPFSWHASDEAKARVLAAIPRRSLRLRRLLRPIVSPTQIGVGSVRMTSARNL